MTTFKEKIFTVVRTIPRGDTMTYKEVATKAGRPRAYRTVGNILNTNYDPKFHVTAWFEVMVKLVAGIGE